MGDTFTRIARIAFKIAITETPTSANTAAHILAYPKAPKINTKNLIPKANTMFWFAMRIVFRAIFITAAIFEGSSVIKTTSAGFDSGIRAKTTHSDTDICPCQYGGIIDSVPDKDKFAFFCFFP